MPSPWIPTGGGGGVTAVTGVPPIASSGGTTPAISIAGTAFNFSPISYQFWISQLAPAGGNGSIKQPVNAVGDAITLAAALPAGSVVDYFMADKDYSSEGILIFPTGKHHRLISMCGGSTFGANVTNVVCGGTPTALTMLDCINTAGIAFTGNGDGTLNLIGSVKDACDVSTVDLSTMTGGNVTINAVNARYALNGNTRCTQVQNLNCTVGTIAANNAAYSHLGGACTGSVSVRTIGNNNNDSPGIVGVELFGNFTVTATSAGSIAGFQSCVWNGALSPPVFTGPVSSFTSDIQSAYSFASQGGSLFGGATTTFTDQGLEGDILTIAGGFPQFVPQSSGTAVQFGAYAVRPTSPQPVGLYITDDGEIEWISDGTNWRPLLNGVVGKQIPLVGAFTTAYGGATFTDAQGSIQVTQAATGSDNLSALTVAKPAGASVLTARCSGIMGQPNDGAAVGIVVSDGTGFHFVGCTYSIGNNFLATRAWAAVGTPGAFGNPGTSGPFGPLWCRIVDDGAGNLTFQLSPDGRCWTDYETIASAGWTEYGIAVASNATIACVFDSFEIA